MDSRVSATTSKAGAIGSSSSKEIQTLTKWISNLMSVVQGAQNKEGKSKNQGSHCNNGVRTKSVVNESENQSKTENQFNSYSFYKPPSPQQDP